MKNMSASTIGIFLLILVFQIVATSLLPKTEGFTNIVWTSACLATYIISFFSMAYLIHNGTPLSLLIPVLSAGVPLATVLVGVFVYNEPVPVSKLVMLCVACGSIGVASTLG